MKPLRALLILIGVLVLAHSIVMALDPHAVHASGRDLSHASVDALICTEDQAVTHGPRVPLEPVLLAIPVAPASGAILDIADGAPLMPQSPSLGGERLRIFLQVFLN